MKDFLTDEEMAALEQEQPAQEPEFISDEEMAQMEATQAPKSESDLPEFSATGGSMGLGLEAIREPIDSKLGKFAEELAYRAAGGRSTAAGKDLVIDTAKNMSAYEPTVTPKAVGREILDQKLLGPAGLGTNVGNVTRAQKNVVKASEPTNELLSKIGTPVNKQDIATIMEYDLESRGFDPAVKSDRMVQAAQEQAQKNLTGMQLPIEAEQSKRKLQKAVNYGTEESAAQAIADKAQARATREAVENAVLKSSGAEKLEEFKRLKARSGAASAAEDILEASAKSGMRSPNLIGSVSGAVGDVVGKKLPGVGASLLDTASKIAKSVPAKAIPFAGMALGGALGYQEAKEKGYSPWQAAAIGAAETVNPLPISVLDYKEGIEKSAKGRASNIASNFSAADKMKTRDQLRTLLDEYKSMNTPASQAIVDQIEGSLSLDKKEAEKNQFLLQQNPEIRRKMQE